MNDSRRKRLTKAYEMIETAQMLIAEVKDEEQEAFDNMSEGLQQTEKAQRMEEVATELDSLGDTLTDVLGEIDTAKE